MKTKLTFAFMKNRSLLNPFSFDFKSIYLLTVICITACSGNQTSDTGSTKEAQKDSVVATNLDTIDHPTTKQDTLAVNSKQSPSMAPIPPPPTNPTPIKKAHSDYEETDIETNLVPTKRDNNSNEFFEPSEIEEQATYIPSEEDFYKLIEDNLTYPKAAKAAGIEDVVWITFTIEVDGSVSNVKGDGKADPRLEAEAIRLIKLSSGKWNPATYKKKAVKSICKVPISFEIK